MATQVINGLVVEVSGEGEALVCIHGLGGTVNTWTPVLPALAQFKIVRIELPGSARSPLPEQKLSIAGYVDAVAGVIDELKLGAVHVVAHSMGTIVAQHLAVGRPDLVKSLALFGPLLAPQDAARPNIAARAELARKGVAGMQEIADAIVNGATGAETKREQPVVLAMVRESIMRQTAEGYAQSCEALAGANAALVSQITVPTLLVTGDQDGVAPPASVQKMGEAIRGSRVVIVDACGHWTTFERPQECIAELKKFY